MTSDGYHVGSRHDGDGQSHPDGWNPTRERQEYVSDAKPDRGTRGIVTVRGTRKEGTR